MARTRLDELPDAAQYAIWVAYLASLGLSFAVPQPFFVLRPSEVLIIAAMSTLPIIIVAHFIKTKQSGLLLAAVHLYAAVLFHPQVNFSEPVYMDNAEQAALLQSLHRGVPNLSVENTMAFRLAHALKTDAALRFEVEHPVITWLFPPSVVLAAWALGVFWLFRPPALSRVSAA